MVVKTESLNQRLSSITRIIRLIKLIESADCKVSGNIEASIDEGERNSLREDVRLGGVRATMVHSATGNKEQSAGN